MQPRLVHGDSERLDERKSDTIMQVHLRSSGGVEVYRLLTSRARLSGRLRWLMTTCTKGSEVVITPPTSHSLVVATHWSKLQEEEVEYLRL